MLTSICSSKIFITFKRVNTSKLQESRFESLKTQNNARVAVNALSLLKISANNVQNKTSSILALIYSKSHKVATQADVRKARGMQMGSVLLDICMF